MSKNGVSISRLPGKLLHPAPAMIANALNPIIVNHLLIADPLDRFLRVDSHALVQTADLAS